VLAARRHLEAAAARAGGPCPRLGVQIETPAAMLLADELLSLSDFALIGISDLLQLLVGADREDPRLLPWMEADHPALLRALASLGEAGCRSGRELWLAVGRQQLRRLGPHLGGLGLSGLVLPPRPRLP
jgi:multiphosphoryl transfer protein